MDAAESLNSIWLAWAGVLAIALAVGAELRRDIRRLVSARNVVLVGIFIWYLQEAISPNPQTIAFSDAARAWAVFLVLLAMAAFLAGYHAGRPVWFDGLVPRLRTLDDETTRQRVLLLGVLIGSVPLVLYATADPYKTLSDILEVRRKWGGALGRGALGDVRAAVLMLETFLFGVAWIAVLLLFDRRRTRGWTLIAAAVLSWHILRAYGTGSRSVLLLALLTPAALVYLRAGAERQRRILLTTPVLALLVYGVAGAMVEGRNEGRLAFEKPVEYYGNEMYRELLFIIDQVPARRDYLWGWTYLVEILNPVPRFLWENKPVGFGVDYAAWHGYDALRGGPNMSPGILGEMYVNFGVAGIVLGSAFGGAVCRSWDRLRALGRGSLSVRLVHTMGLGCLLMMGRSVSLSMYYPLIASLLCLEFVLWQRRRTVPPVLGGATTASATAIR